MRRPFAAALVFPALLAANLQDGPRGTPDAVVDLRTAAGAALVKGQWRYSDVAITQSQPGGQFDYAPKAGAASFDDSSWEAVAPESLEQRRGKGRLSFAWYRINVTVPERVAGFSTAGSTAVFEIVLDDYAEIWVDGKLPVVLGQAGGHLVKGFNAPNRVVLGRNVRPGQQFQLAVFGINGPISASPANFIWVRSVTLDFYREARTTAGRQTGGRLVSRDPAFDAIFAPGTRIEKLAAGFEFTEGPVWVPASVDNGEGFLLFSDPNANSIYRWTEDGDVSIFRPKSGYAGPDIGEYRQPGSNGLALDREGRLTVAEHGRRRIVRIEPKGQVTVLADRFEGQPLNSPNDLVYRSDGSLYFTDPPFGLPKFFDDPRKALPFSGVFRWAPDGRLSLLSRDLAGPNGIAFSPDERFLYVTNWDEKKKVVMRYPVRPDGGLDPGTVFYDMTPAPGEEALDGVKVDRAGNLFVSGPGGVWVLSPDGRHLGTLQAPELPANMAWGGDDGKTLYLTARSGLYRVRTLTGRRI